MQCALDLPGTPPGEKVRDESAGRDNGQFCQCAWRIEMALIHIGNALN